MSEEAKQLKLKTGVCKRLTKELSSYLKETTQQKAKVDSLKASGADEHAIKKQEEENYSVIPDVRTRLQRSIDDLSSYMKAHTPAPEEKSAAESALADAAAALEAMRGLVLQ